MISKRLSVISDMVPDNARVADIGTDHAYLPIALMKSGRVKSVIAADIADKPLENAEKNIKASKQNITLRKSDGLEKISKDEVDTVIIAGMGGEVIAGILDNCVWAKDRDKTFIFQPMTSAEILRTYLSENGFSLLSEVPVSENGKYYSVMKYCFSGRIIKLTNSEKYIGKVNNTTYDGKKYIEKQYKRLSKAVKQLSASGRAQSELACLEHTLSEIKAVLDK